MTDGGMAGRDSYLLAVVDRKLGISAVVTLFSLALVVRGAYSKMNWIMTLLLNAFAGLCLARLAVNLLRLPALKALYRHQPWVTAPWTLGAAAWEIAVGLFIPKHGRAVFFSCCLPPLPLPSLHATLSRHIATLQVILPADALARVLHSTNNLDTPKGEALQRALCDGGRGTTHGWLAPWERRRVAAADCIAAGRFYLLDGVSVPVDASGQQATRAASLIAGLLKFRNMIRNREIPARGFLRRSTDVPKSVPRCMWAYETLFNTSLAPAEGGYRTITRLWRECDKHILVFCRGFAYKMVLKDELGQVLSQKAMRKHLEYILKVSEQDAKRKKGGPRCVESFSRLRRAEAAAARTLIGICKETSDLLETAAFAVSLDTCVCENFSQQAFLAITGDSTQDHPGSGRWLEKPFTLVVSPNGRASLLCVEPLAERTAVSHMWECALAQEEYPLPGGVDAASPPCTRIEWKASLANVVIAASEAYLLEAHSLNLKVLDLSEFSRAKIRHSRIAPHALLHLAAQAAYGRTHDGEACFSQAWVSTRIFKHGKHEYVRTSTPQSLALQKALDVSSRATLSEQRVALLAAAKAYMNLYKQSLLGKGVSMHLNALLQAACASGESSTRSCVSDLETLLEPKCKLTTCTSPVQVDAKTPASAVSVGGGLQPQSEGYGVAFALVGDDVMLAHIYGMGFANVDEFARHLTSVLRDIRHIMTAVKSARVDDDEI